MINTGATMTAGDHRRCRGASTAIRVCRGDTPPLLRVELRAMAMWGALPARTSQ
jgi:hypothetical protein